MLERAKGIEPSYSAWEADVLPLNYARTSVDYYTPGFTKCQGISKIFSILFFLYTFSVLENGCDDKQTASLSGGTSPLKGEDINGILLDFLDFRRFLTL